MSPPLISKAAARYTGAGGKEHCSLCRHFSPRRGGRCARVLGDISPMGWCRLFSRELRGLVADASSFNGGGGGPSLALDFMTPGTLDPRITFTRASTARYFDSAGVMQTAAINTPRWDYDPVTHALRGLLLEDQTTNMFLNTALMTGTGWLIGNATVTNNAGTAPDGTNTLNKLTETVVTGFHCNRQTVTITAGIPLTMSVYAKAAERKYLILGMDDLAANSIGVRYDLEAGTSAPTGGVTGTGVITSHSITPIGGGIYRCVLSGTLATVTSLRTAVSLSDGSGAGNFPSYLGVVGNGIFLWGQQLEAKDFATSYVVSGGTQATRSIDSCLIPPANMAPWFAPPGGSWFAEFIHIDATPSNQRVISRPDATGGPVSIYSNPSYQVGQYDGIAAVNSATAIVVNTVSKCCTTWAVGSAKACTNNGNIATSAALTTGHAALAGTGVKIMTGTVSNSESFSGCIRAVRYWPTVLTDAEMRAVTT